MEILCGKGWKKLYDPIIELVNEFDNCQTIDDSKICLERVESSFGKLHFVFKNEQNLTHEIKSLVNDASFKSINICEYCGTDKHVGTTLNFAYATCCGKCWQQNILASHIQSVWRDNTTKKIYNKKKLPDMTKTTINNAVFIVFAEFLGYASKLISWAEEICEGKSTEAYVKSVLNKEAKRIYNSMTNEYTIEEIKTYWDKFYPLLLEDYDKNILQHIKSDGSDMLPFE